MKRVEVEVFLCDSMLSDEVGVWMDVFFWILKVKE